MDAELVRTPPRENTENCSPVSMPVIFDIVLNIENLYSISSLQEEIEVATTYLEGAGLNILLFVPFGYLLPLLWKRADR